MKKEKFSGIYCFENILDGKKYVGQAKDVFHRIDDHFLDLRKSMDGCSVFQNAWNKYKEENFIYYIVEKCDEEQLNERECFWIKELKSHISEWGYNISWGGNNSMKGYKHSEEIRKIMSQKWKGRIVSEEARKICQKLKREEGILMKLERKYLNPKKEKL